MSAVHLEKYSKGSCIRRIRLGLISAITAVNLNKEQNAGFAVYDQGAREILKELGDENSTIYDVAPKILEKNRDKIELSLKHYPHIESQKHLVELLKAFS